MASDAQQPPKVAPDDTHDQVTEQSEERHPNLSYRASRLIAMDTDFHPSKYIRASPEPPEALPPWALARAQNPLFPLIKQKSAPFLFVHPATVMAPTAEETHLDPPRAALPRVPTVLLRDFTAHKFKSNKGPATQLQQEQESALIAQMIASQSSVVSSDAPKMPPPPVPSQKRKRDE